MFCVKTFCYVQSLLVPLCFTVCRTFKFVLIFDAETLSQLFLLHRPLYVYAKGSAAAKIVLQVYIFAIHKWAFQSEWVRNTFNQNGNNQLLAIMSSGIWGSSFFS